MWDPMVTPSADNGVTTVVMGNCAVGIAPCPKPLRGFVTDLCDAIEDIPAPAINSLENFWQWETFPECKSRDFSSPSPAKKQSR